MGNVQEDKKHYTVEEYFALLEQSEEKFEYQKVPFKENPSEADIPY